MSGGCVSFLLPVTNGERPSMFDVSRFTFDDSRLTQQLPDLCKVMVVVFGDKKQVINESHRSL